LPNIDPRRRAVPDNLYLVFSKPPDEVSGEEYDRWYDQHVRENIVVPGFLAARRFAVDPVIVGSRTAPRRFAPASGDGGASVAYSHLAMYEFEGDIESLRTALFERIESGETILPEWFDEIRFATWTCTSLGDRIEPGR
jgi:hypothetical protein